MSQHHQQLFSKLQQDLMQTRQMVQAQHQFLTDQQRYQQHQARQSQVENFDKSLVDLGEDWSDLFGRDSYQDIDPNSAEMFNRGKVLRTYDQLAELHQRQGRRVDPDAILMSSLKIAFPDRQVSRTQKSAAGKPQPRDQVGRYASYTNKPSGKQGAAKTDKRQELYNRWDSAFGGSDNNDDGVL